MRLKSLEMQGFKSFPDKTILNFDRGVTAVVGPNGSGKSNISDAMRWVLGEISSKSIRGTKMEDVIFGGTDNRRPMGFAEVSLTIDNTDPENRMAIDYDEVTVTRRLYRSGESEYMINRKPVRLKDITELFMNTGIGRTGYSIISQGKAAEIISQKSDERRNIFEEAAGISKYRYKKNEAERKLVEVDDNLIRINDILSELQGRVEPLEKESIRARKYLELYAQKKEADVSLTIFDISDIKNRSEKLDADYNIAKHELEIADDTIHALETKSDKLFSEIQANKLRYEQITRLIRENNEKKFEFESSGKVYENDIVHINEQLRQSESDKLQKLNELNLLKQKNESLDKDAETKKDSLCSVVSEYEEVNSAVNSFAEMLDKIEDEIEKTEKEISSANEKLINAKIELSTLEASSRSGDDLKESISAELETLNQSILLLNERISRADKAMGEYKENIDALNSQLNEVTQEEEKLLAEKQKLTDAQNRRMLDISAKKQRADALRRMEELFEGYANSVRAVMNASDNGRLYGIYGPVSRIINVSGKFSTALETALGGNIQNIVVEDERSAKSAIEFLKENHKGRATFYPLTSIKPQYLNVQGNELSAYKGYIGIASELCDTDKKFRPVVDFLLARTVIFDNIDNAAVMARANNYRIRVVTLDGQIINAGGSFTGGSVNRDSGILTRNADIEKSEEEIVKLQAQFDRTKETLKEIENKLKDTVNNKNDYQGRISLFTSLYSAEETQRKILQAQYESDNERLGTLSNNMSDVDSQLLKYQSKHKELSVEIEGFNNLIAEHEKALQTLISTRRSTTLEQSEKQMYGNSLLLKIAELKKDIEISQSRLDNCNEAIESVNNQIEHIDRQIVELNNKLTSITDSLKASKASAINITDEISRLENELSELNENNINCERKESEIRDEMKNISHRREIIFRDYTKLEAQRAQILEQQDKLLQHLWDEYELTFSSALALGYPVVTEETRKSVVAKQTEVKNKLRALGSVNVNAIEEYEEVKTRYEFMRSQFDDLSSSKEELSNVIFKLEKEMRIQFTTVLEQINKNFKTVFRELFGGGNAELSLSDPDNVLVSGIEINVAPPGKIIKNLAQLSGGEQSFVAIALFFSILKVNPTPFCVLDEIEAALDEVNVQRFAEYCKKYSGKTQFIIITHRRSTMESADILYGVTMYERGVSKVLSVNVNEVEQKIGVKL